MAKYKLPKVEDLFEAGVHFGHQIRRWHPKMEKYIFTVKKNIHIIDLEETEKGLKAACDFAYAVAAAGGQIIFVGTKRQAAEIVENEAKRSGALYVTQRWLGGTLTNFAVIKKNTKKLTDYLKKREEGGFKSYTKKERLLIDREIEKLQASVGGIVALRGVPSAVFVVDAKREHTAIKESNVSNVPVIGLVDTNTDPKGISYVIPGNDDALKSIALIVKSVADAVEAGYKEYAANLEKGKVPASTTVAAEVPVAEDVAKNVTASESPILSDQVDVVPANELEVEISEVAKKLEVAEESGDKEAEGFKKKKINKTKKEKK